MRRKPNCYVQQVFMSITEVSMICLMNEIRSFNYQDIHQRFEIRRTKERYDF